MNTKGWRAEVSKIFSDASSQIHFDLNGIDGGSVMNMINNPHRSSTNWEIHVLYTQFRKKFDQTLFYLNGNTYVGSEIFTAAGN